MKKRLPFLLVILLLIWLWQKQADESLPSQNTNPIPTQESDSPRTNQQRTGQKIESSPGFSTDMSIEEIPFGDQSVTLFTKDVLTGQTVAEANLFITFELRNQNEALSISAQTNEDGSLFLPIPTEFEEGMFTVFALKGDLVNKTKHHFFCQDEGPHDIWMDRGTWVEIKVVDRDGMGIPGAELSANPPNFKTATDSFGTWRGVLPREIIHLKAQAEGFAESQKSIAVRLEQSYTIQLTPGIALFGTVTDLEGNPLAGIKVGNGQHWSAPTKEDGLYEFGSYHPHKKIHLVTQPSHYWESLMPNPNWVPRKQWDISMNTEEIKANKKFKGRVYSPEGPLEGVKIEVAGKSFLTDKKGEVTFEIFTTEKLRATFSKEDYLTTEEPIYEDFFSVFMNKGRTLKGWVQNKSGQPVKAHLTTFVGSMEPGLKDLGWTDNEGWFEVSIVEHSEVTFSADGYASKQVRDFPEGEQLILLDQESLTVRAVDGQNKPLSQYTLLFRLKISWIPPVEVRDPEGIFVLDLKPDPTFEIRASHQKLCSDWVQVEENQQEITLTLEEKEGTVGVRVVDQNGNPVNHVPVVFYNSMEASHPHFVGSPDVIVNTDKNGVAIHEKCEPIYNYQAKVHHQDYWSTIVNLGPPNSQEILTEILVYPAASVTVVLDRTDFPGTYNLGIYFNEQSIESTSFEEGSSEKSFTSLPAEQVIFKLHGKKSFTKSFYLKPGQQTIVIEEEKTDELISGTVYVGDQIAKNYWLQIINGKEIWGPNRLDDQGEFAYPGNPGNPMVFKLLRRSEDNQPRSLNKTPENFGPLNLHFPEFGTLRGKIVPPNDVHIRGAIRAHVKADAQGNIQFPDLPPGPYLLGYKRLDLLEFTKPEGDLDLGTIEIPQTGQVTFETGTDLPFARLELEKGGLMIGPKMIFQLPVGTQKVKLRPDAHKTDPEWMQIHVESGDEITLHVDLVPITEIWGRVEGGFQKGWAKHLASGSIFEFFPWIGDYNQFNLRDLEGGLWEIEVIKSGEITAKTKIELTPGRLAWVRL